MGLGGGTSVLIRPALGLHGGDEPASAGGDLEARARLLACVRGGWGVQPGAGAPLPSKAGWLLGYSDVTSCSGRAWRWGSAVASPRAENGQRACQRAEWSQQGCRPLLSVSRCAVAGRTLAGVRAEGPCWWPTSRWRPTCSPPPFRSSGGGLWADLEDVGEAALSGSSALLTHWRLCGAALVNSWLVLASG